MSHQAKRSRSASTAFPAAPAARVWKGKSKASSGVVAAVVRQMKSAVEKKVVDTASALYACDTTGSVTLINGCAQGTDFTNRIGRKYTNVSAQLEGLILPQDNTTNGVKAKVMIVYDSQPNGVLPTITAILTASTSNAFQNLDNRDRFRVVYSETWAIGGVDNTATSAVAGSPTVADVSVWRDLTKKQCETICDGTTAGIADINTGALYLVTIGNQAASSGANFFGAVRVRYTDQ